MDQKYSFTQKYNDTTFHEEIEAVVSKEEFAKLVAKAKSDVQKNASYKGFRKGNVPENVLMSVYGTEISDQAINHAINTALQNFEDIRPRPIEPIHVENVKVDDDGNLVILYAYLPSPEVNVEIPKPGVKKPKPKKVKQDEVEKEVQNVWFHYAKNINPDVKKEDYNADDIGDDFFEKSGVKNENPNINSLQDLREFIEKYLQSLSLQEADIALRDSIRDALISNSKFEKLEGIVSKELDNRIEKYKSQFTSLGIDPDDYLKEKDVNLDALRDEWRDKAEQDIKFELCLQQYGREQQIEPTQEEIDAEIAKLDEQTKKHYNNDVQMLTSLVRYYYVNQKSFDMIAQELVVSDDTPARDTKKKEVKKDK